jgi:ferredoxin
MSWRRAGEAGAGATASKLRVDMIACDGYGVCAELVPEMIRMDEWGYPILAPGAVPDDLIRHARRAVTLCPKHALSLIPASQRR